MNENQFQKLAQNESVYSYDLLGDGLLYRISAQGGHLGYGDAEILGFSESKSDPILSSVKKYIHT